MAGSTCFLGHASTRKPGQPACVEPAFITFVMVSRSSPMWLKSIIWMTFFHQFFIDFQYIFLCRAWVPQKTSAKLCSFVQNGTSKILSTPKNSCILFYEAIDYDSNHCCIKYYTIILSGWQDFWCTNLWAVCWVFSVRMGFECVLGGWWASKHTIE